MWLRDKRDSPEIWGWGVGGTHDLEMWGWRGGGGVCDVVQPQKHHPGASRETPQETQC